MELGVLQQLCPDPEAAFMRPRQARRSGRLFMSGGSRSHWKRAVQWSVWCMAMIPFAPLTARCQQAATPQQAASGQQADQLQQQLQQCRQQQQRQQQRRRRSGDSSWITIVDLDLSSPIELLLNLFL